MPCIFILLILLGTHLPLTLISRGRCKKLTVGAKLCIKCSKFIRSNVHIAIKIFIYLEWRD